MRSQSLLFIVAWEQAPEHMLWRGESGVPTDLLLLHIALQPYKGVSLPYACDVEWFALEMNSDHSFVFEVAPKNCISNSLVDCEAYAISSKGFLPTVVDIMVIWVKSTHSSPFSFTDC